MQVLSLQGAILTLRLIRSPSSRRGVAGWSSAPPDAALGWGAPGAAETGGDSKLSRDPGMGPRARPCPSADSRKTWLEFSVLTGLTASTVAAEPHAPKSTLPRALAWALEHSGRRHGSPTWSLLPAGVCDAVINEADCECPGMWAQAVLQSPSSNPSSLWPLVSSSKKRESQWDAPQTFFEDLPCEK